ncbi:MAG: protein kinase domain-containing protein [bacterium]
MTMIGEKISHYRIIAKLGGGGMGVVYKAEDSKLKRPVALKFLPPELSRDAESKERFVHEAQAASALDHPNICTIYEIGETEDEQIFIAMAYYEGETLKKKVASGQLSVGSVIDVAIQMAQGLAKAHTKGIVHRDIKPANVFVTNDGLVKILDFGLAKLTGQTRLTRTGTTLGTPAYMSPEQVSLLETDQRTDIWSLGVVMYEMLTGQLPFKGEHHHTVMYAIVSIEPEQITSLRADVPVELKRIVNQCLVKKPAERYQHVSDLQVDLRRLQRTELSSANATILPLSQKQTQTRNRLFWPLASLLILIAGALAIYVFKPFSKTPIQPMKIAPFTSLPGIERSPAFSPDGKQIAFMWREQDTSDFDIYVQLVGTNEPLRLTTHPGNDLSPVWSPDGRHIAFSRVSEDGRERSISIIPALGGMDRKVFLQRIRHGLWVELLNGFADDKLSWSPDGKLLAFTDIDSTKSIFLLSLEHLEQRQLTSAPTGGVEVEDYYPAFSPDGKRLAFVRRVSWWVSDLYTVPVAGGEVERLTFDAKNINGLAWTQNGQEIIFSSNRGGAQELWRIAANGGTAEPIAASGQNVYTLTISPDGQRLAYAEYVEDMNIERIEMHSSPNQKVVPSRLIASTKLDADGYFSPDGKRIAFASERTGNNEIWVCDKDGRNPVQLTFLESGSGTPNWSPDGKKIAFDSRREGNSDIFVVSADGGTPKPLTAEPSEDFMPSWSRDGRWLYFGSTRSGVQEIWKIPTEGGPAIQLTKDGGFRAFESTDGSWVYYSRDFNSPIWKIPVTGGEKSLVLDCRINGWAWTIFEDGIYYVNSEITFGANIEFLDFATNKVKKIAALASKKTWSPRISPDGRWLIYNYPEITRVDIMLVENFR